MRHKLYHLKENPIPEGYRIYVERLPVAGLHLRRSCAAAYCGGSDRALNFKPEPGNKHDPNAILIIGSWKGWFFKKERVLGYVPAEYAEKLTRVGLADAVKPRLLKTYRGADGFVEIEFQIIGPKDRYHVFNPSPLIQETDTPNVTGRDEEVFARLDNLITFLMQAKIITPEERERLWKEHCGRAVSRMFETGETFGQASGGPSILNGTQDEVRDRLKGIDNDLPAQLEIVDTTCRGYFVTGDIPAPHYAWRVAVILSKRKEKDKEKSFLAAWCRHFSFGTGGTYGDLVKRAEKLGVGITPN